MEGKHTRSDVVGVATRPEHAGHPVPSLVREAMSALQTCDESFEQRHHALCLP